MFQIGKDLGDAFTFLFYLCVILGITSFLGLGYIIFLSL